MRAMVPDRWAETAAADFAGYAVQRPPARLVLHRAFEGRACGICAPFFESVRNLV